MVTGGRRPGHSLPELIVAVTFLATTMVAVGATMVLGGQWTARAVQRQEAVRLGAAVLDSVAGAVGAGEVVRNGLRARWTAADGGVRVEVEPEPGGRVLVQMEGNRLLEIPVLPDAGGDTTSAVLPP